MRTLPQAVNARTEAIPVLGEDPNGRFLFDAVTASAAAGGLGGHVQMGEKSDPSRTFNGWAAAPQAFLGAGQLVANLGMTATSAPRDQRFIDTPSTAATNPAMQVFADRLARGAQ